MTAILAVLAVALLRKVSVERAAKRRRDVLWAKLTGNPTAADTMSPLAEQLTQLQSAARGVTIEAAGVARRRWVRVAGVMLPDVKAAFEEGESAGYTRGCDVGWREAREATLRLVADNPQPGDHHYRARHAAG
jgi:hypothetical protein